MSTDIYDMSCHDLWIQLVGKTIAEIDDDTIRLTDGTRLRIDDASSCCAWYEGDIKAFDFENNVITAVEEVDTEPQHEGAEAWTLRVLSNHTLVAQVDIEGDPASGYYCHSVNLRVSAVSDEH